MKKLTPFLCYSLVLLLLCQFCSCIKPPPNFNPADAGNVYPGCRINKITNDNGHSYPPVIVLFTYNNNNDPVSAIGTVVSTGRPKLIFKYDNKKRLIQCGYDYNANAGFEILHRYGYSQNRISTDTTYVLGNYNADGEPVGFFDKRLTYIQYDNFGRVVQDSMIPLLHANPYIITKYKYDQAGNLVFRAFGETSDMVYDNKLNPHRTNKIWMFIDRNYSVNNPGKATTYNTMGLPLTYTPEPGVYGLVFASFTVNNSSQLEYDCK